MRTNLFIALCSVVFLSCNQKNINTVQEYLTWMNNRENNLRVEKEYENITLEAKYLPSGYLTYQEIKDNPAEYSSRLDSIHAQYDQHYTFLLSIRDKNPGKGQVMMNGVGSYEEFKQRVSRLNFNVQESLKLQVGEESYTPAIATLENDYELGGALRVFVVFPVEKNNEASQEMTLTFTDEFFSTGINHFAFDYNDIQNIPPFPFDKIKTS